MTDAITAEQFHDSEDVEDWRVLRRWACARFRTGSFAKGKQLVDAISDLSEAANHHPDVDLRYGTVDIRITSHDVGGLSRRDVALAREISAAASDLGIEAHPGEIMLAKVTIDALDIPAVKPFWQAALGYDDWDSDHLADPAGHGPLFWFQQMDAPRSQRNRIHIDVAVPHDEAEARVAAAIEAGGRLVTDEHAPAWWVLADPEGNEACIATWQGRG